MNHQIPPYTWTRRFDESPPKQGKPIGFSLRLLAKQLPFIYRAVRRVIQERRLGRLPVLDMLRGVPTGPDMGVPLGGLGGGTITRGWRGDFVRWQLQPGIVHHGRVWADQFSLWVQRPGEPPAATVLYPGSPEGGALGAWTWGLPAEKGTYHALFPRAWTVYEAPLPGLRLTCRQVSPVIPNNYRESSFPAAVFVWTIDNTGDQAAEATILFTFQNGAGTANDTAGGHSNHLVRRLAAGGELVAVELSHVHRQTKALAEGQAEQEPVVYSDPLTLAIAALAGPEVEISYRSRFQSNADGRDLWADFAGDGRLDNLADPNPAAPGESIGAALAARVQLPAGASRQVAFALAWDMPLARFALGTAWYRRYTRFYGRAGDAAARIALDALGQYPEWEEQIQAWQQPVLSDAELPGWYKAALFNEAYYLVDGGTIWTAGAEAAAPAGQELLPEPEIGHFAYLESHEYRMYNTYDVHFNASFTLAMLWPELELSLQRDFIHALDVEDAHLNTIWHSGKKVPRKVRGIVPHDLGSPTADPWRELNAYLAQDTSRWKDLNAKFVLQIYRDYTLTGDRRFLTDAYPAMTRATAYLAQFDKDGDGLIENEGYPDQTYDTWTMAGPSAYCGGLWLACLGAMAAAAEALGQIEEARAYRQRLERAQPAFEARLWNGEYYDFDASRSGHHDSIMADQLAGQWFAGACGLPGIVPADHARSAFGKIYHLNVRGVGNGRFGAVNGMRPNGRVDTSCLQSSEMWFGTTYALAAAMLQEGMTDEAFATAYGAYYLTYHDFGLWFQTPEAITPGGVFRALGYMRPLAIWAIQWAWERRKR